MDPRLLERYADVQLEELVQRFPRALEDNLEGGEVLVAALQRAVSEGYQAWCQDEGNPAVEPVVADWPAWQTQRALTPEAERWPERLADGVGSAGIDALRRAEEWLVEAGTELGMTGLGGGARARRALVDVGRQAAEAGAALRVALDLQLAEPETEPQPDVVHAPETPVTEVRSPPGETVRVATAANIAECELMQGRLAAYGIPSIWRRSGGDAPHFLSAGDRDIYVPAPAAAHARAILAPVEADAESEEAPTRAVGLERSSLRRTGKMAILLCIAPGLGILVAQFAGVTWGIAVAVGCLILVVAVVAWSERQTGLFG